jgi:hypothetical protein
MSYFTSTVTVYNSSPAIIVANDTVDRTVVSVSGASGVELGFTSGTCAALQPTGEALSFVLPAGVDLYGNCTVGTYSTIALLVTKVPDGPSSFSGTLSGTFS